MPLASAGMQTREAFQLMQRSMSATAELAARGAPDSRTLTLPGVTAAITPATPDRSVLNGVVVEDFAKLPAVLDEIAAAYAEAGVRAWTVWVPEYEREARDLLAGAGHVLDAMPAAMLLDLDELAAPPRSEPDWNGEWDIEAAGRINDAAYGDEPGLFARGMGDLPAESGHMYLARAGGDPASFVVVHDHEDNCEFWIAATVPEARGRGLLSGLLHRALVDARARGCTTSTTQATRMGEPVYARLGYRKFGTIEMWERREPAPGAA
jgi:GNAT superfamily N-acetyltransferase